MSNYRASVKSSLRLRGDAKEIRDVEIERRYLAGETIQVIAVSLGMSYSLARSILKERSVPIRSPGKRIRDNEVRNAEFEQRYLAGESMQEIGESLGITRERVRQILEKRGVQSRPAKPPSGPRRQTRRKVAAHRQAIVELKRQGLTNKEIARRFHLGPYFVNRMLRGALSEEEQRMFRTNTGRERTPETQLLEQIREAHRALGSTMREKDYDAYAKTRGWIGGYQTLLMRFGSWSRVCELAGISIQTRCYRHKRKDFINRKTCLDAIRHVRNAIGHIPTMYEYDRYARTASDLPCVAVVRRRCGGWKNVIRVLLTEQGPQEASGK